jgi:hypothetical protein
VALVALSATGHQRRPLVPTPHEGLSQEMDQFTGPVSSFRDIPN